MKVKISFGSSAIKGMIIKHVEKAVVAFAVLFFLLLVWRASKLGGDFDLQPDQLQNTSVEADKAIRAPKKGPDENVPPWEEIATGIRTPVPAWPYGIEKTWMHKLFPGATLRGQPVVFPVEELRGSTGFGGISMKSASELGQVGGAEETSTMEAGAADGYQGGGVGFGGTVEGRRWVVLTGLLPYKKQWMEYGNVFRNAEIKDSRRDVPAYVHYDVERAEVVPGVDPAEGDWKPLPVAQEYYTRLATWVGGQPEVVYGKFLHRSAGLLPMAYPLPPVNKAFGPEIAHEPEIPLYYQEERKIEKQEIDWKKIANDPEALAKAKAQLGRSQGQYGGEDAYGPDYTQDYGQAGMGDMGMGDMGMGDEMGGAEGYGGLGPRREIPEYQLFRFFDFTVLPGRYYQYRVRVRLANPNYQMPPQILENEKLAEQQFLDTPWSVETKVVSVPLDSRVLVGPVSVPANVNAAPVGELGTVFFNEKDGKEVAEKFSVRRGMLLNYFGVDVKEEEKPTSLYSGEADLGMAADAEGGMYGAPPPKEKVKKEPPKKVDYVTEMLVLDFDGGDSFPGTDRNLKGPGRVLLMDPAGNLILQQELTDQEEWIEFFPPEAKKKEEAPMGAEMDPAMM